MSFLFKTNEQKEAAELAKKEKQQQLKERADKKINHAKGGLGFLKGLLPTGWQKMVMQEVSNGLQEQGITDAVLTTDENGIIQLEVKMDGVWYDKVPLVNAFSFKDTDMQKMLEETNTRKQLAAPKPK